MVSGGIFVGLVIVTVFLMMITVALALRLVTIEAAVIMLGLAVAGYTINMVLMCQTDFEPMWCFNTVESHGQKFVVCSYEDKTSACTNIIYGKDGTAYRLCSWKNKEETNEK